MNSQKKVHELVAIVLHDVNPVNEKPGERRTIGTKITSGILKWINNEGRASICLHWYHNLFTLCKKYTLFLH